MSIAEKALLFAATCVAVLFLSSVDDARAAERILRYHSDITVNTDGSMTVQETIQVLAEGKRIKRGIYRDFPTIYREKFGFVRKAGFRVLEVLRDGIKEDYHNESQSNGERVYIGKKDHYLTPGPYTYRITYSTDRQLGFFDKFTELYWNVTGNGWEFPIDRASAAVHLPEKARKHIYSTGGYTGPKGSKRKDYSSSIDDLHTVHFMTTRPLGPGEGLTIVVSWEKGHIAAPGPGEIRTRFIKDNKGLSAGIAGILLVLVYYSISWIIAGRDPRKGTIIPQYTPFDGLSPASMRFITKMGFDHETFAAALVSMAVKGHIIINEEDGEYTLQKRNGQGEPLSPEELKISEKLFGSSKSITLENSEHRKVSAALLSARRVLSLNYEKKYFVKNLAYFIPGMLLSVVAVITSIVLSMMVSPEMFLVIWLSIWSIGVYFLLSQMIKSWREVMSKRRHRIIKTGQALFLTLFSIPFVIAEIVALVIYLTMGPPLLLLIPLVIIFINYVFYRLLKAPTRAGRKILDGIEGFRLFLNVTEKDRLNILHPPEKNIETFERYLPYALALDLGSEWGEYFSDVVTQAGQAVSSYSPSWYHGTGWDSFGSGTFVSSLGSSLGGAISSSSSAPGSGSGGGGGGSSGGGGGGGGGGGW